MTSPNWQTHEPPLWEKLEWLLSETAGMLDGLERSSRSLWGVSEAAAPALVGGMKAGKGSREAKLIQRMRELIPYLEAARAELARCDHNLAVLRRNAKKLNLDEAREELEQATVAQEVQRERGERLWPEVLDMICRIADGLRWSHGLPVSLPPSPASLPGGPGALSSQGSPLPTAGHEIDNLMSMGPTNDF